METDSEDDVASESVDPSMFPFAHDSIPNEVRPDLLPTFQADRNYLKNLSAAKAAIISSYRYPLAPNKVWKDNSLNEYVTLNKFFASFIPLGSNRGGSLSCLTNMSWR